MNDVHNICRFIKKINPAVSPLKLQKSLYFMYAYYGASTGKELFQANFEAWNYGSVIREVYLKNKEGLYDDIEAFDESVIDMDQQEYIRNLFRQIDTVSDFTLVDRNYMDSSFMEAKARRTPEKMTIIDNLKLIAEYKEDYF